MSSVVSAHTQPVDDTVPMELGQPCEAQDCAAAGPHLLDLDGSGGVEDINAKRASGKLDLSCSFFVHPLFARSF